MDFFSKLTNAIVIELEDYMIKNNYTWKLLCDILLCKKVKTLLNAKSSLIAKKKIYIYIYIYIYLYV